MLNHPRFVGPAAAVLMLVAVCLEIAAQSDERIASLAKSSLSQISGELVIPGLTANVEVIRDKWGVPHIYARNQDDLFMAQGYVMAQDRLWQMEMWRRQAEGRMAEILGPQAVARDRVARMLKFRGPFDDREALAFGDRGI
jgi:acyl-homoserine lactone acylase PvdQ